LRKVKMDRPVISATCLSVKYFKVNPPWFQVRVCAHE
jgi:hypothetical protein